VYGRPRAVVIALETNVKATCRYATEPGIAFDDMPHLFENTGGTAHSTLVNTRRMGVLHTCYVKARDEFGNTNFDDYLISFLPVAGKFVPFSREIDAACGKLVRPMKIVRDVQAPGGRYVASPKKEEGRVTYVVNVPETDDYLVWVLVQADSTSENAFFVAVDGEAEYIFDVSVEGGKWHWQPVGARNPDGSMALATRVFTLTRGRHALDFRCRKPHTRLARLIVTNDRKFSPKKPVPQS